MVNIFKAHQPILSDKLILTISPRVAGVSTLRIQKNRNKLATERNGQSKLEKLDSQIRRRRASSIAYSDKA